MTNSAGHGLASRIMIVIALAAVTAALVGSFWPMDNSAGVGCGSVLVSTSQAADRDLLLRDRATRELIARSPASVDGTVDTYQNNIGSPPVDDGPLSILTSSGNVGLCENLRSTIRTYLYGGTAAVLVVASVGWVWLRRRGRDSDGRIES